MKPRFEEEPFEIEDAEPLLYDGTPEEDEFDESAFELALARERADLGLAAEPIVVENGMDFDALAYGRALELARAKKLGKGDKDGDATRALQESLSAAGYELEVDGEFGPKTESAVREFQKANGLPVTGKIGEKDVDKLNKIKPKEDKDGSTDPTIDASKPFVATNLPERDKRRQEKEDRRKEARADRREREGGPVGADSGGSSRGRGRGDRGGSAGTSGGNRDRQAPENPEFERKHKRGEGGKFVSKGSAGALVKSVQELVGVKTDGKFGAKTEAAVREYQKKNNLQVDGVVGSQTAASLLGGKDKKPGALAQGQLGRLRSTGSVKRRKKRMG